MPPAGAPFSESFTIPATATGGPPESVPASRCGLLPTIGRADGAGFHFHEREVLSAHPLYEAIAAHAPNPRLPADDRFAA
jgi:hypothetical protein